MLSSNSQTHQLLADAEVSHLGGRVLLRLQLRLAALLLPLLLLLRLLLLLLVLLCCGFRQRLQKCTSSFSRKHSAG